MMKGVKLRCINAPYKHMVAGNYYEIAEIMEMPNHAMARKPNGKWPKPGESWFAFHANECFSVPPQGIPAFSCGYTCEEREFFGTIIPNLLFSTPPPSRFPKGSRRRSYVSNLVDLVGIPGLFYFTYHDVVQKVCVPETLEKQFMLIGIEYRDMQGTATAKTATRAIKSVMRKLGIPNELMPAVEEQQMEFWHPSWRKAGPWKWKTPPTWDP